MPLKDTLLSHWKDVHCMLIWPNWHTTCTLISRLLYTYIQETSPYRNDTLMLCFSSAQTPCPGSFIPSTTANPNFDVNSYKITHITPCSSNQGDFAGNVCGFKLYVYGSSNGVIGCGKNYYTPWNNIIFYTNEVVLRVSLCFDTPGTLTFLHQWSLDTNRRTIGPMGNSCSGFTHVLGHQLTGFTGNAGWGVDLMGVNFNRCAP